jgi:hypothetical protein
MNTNTSMPMGTRTSTTTSILTRIKNTAMSTLTRMNMNTRISTVMNMIIKGTPMFILMSMRANTDRTNINIPDMRRRYTSTKM